MSCHLRWVLPSKFCPPLLLSRRARSPTSVHEKNSTKQRTRQNRVNTRASIPSVPSMLGSLQNLLNQVSLIPKELYCVTVLHKELSKDSQLLHHSCSSRPLPNKQVRRPASRTPLHHGRLCSSWWRRKAHSSSGNSQTWRTCAQIQNPWKLTSPLRLHGTRHSKKH